MAQQFPHVRFDGLDIVPIATRYPPANVRFEMHDIAEPFRYANGTYDLVHGRSISMAVRDYPALVDEVARVLRPGGLFVGCEFNRIPAMAHGRDASTHLPLSSRFFDAVNQTLYFSKGILNVAPCISRILNASDHFDEVHQLRVEMPVGGDHFGTCFKGLLKMYVEGLKVVLLDAGWSRAQVDDLARGYLHEMEHIPGMVSIYHAVYARKRAV
ncbi:hypothetical protein BXZ70DRAFT_951500 [Cristinia sonorae]|uniref:Methyltransferase domain-containing protein n=1 Tax=Cristinia sonorae TaxID=1940300 RepID=A0A8K0UIT3_9AGAR|nr:hypothetical protein BXZ70DRAFT_951500 [Cristinia sonorae]